MSIITLLTDFGTGSPYVAVMKGVILSIHPAVTLVDLSHEVPPQDVRGGALILEEAADRFPPETIHVAVVDPGVGTDRAIVYARIGRQNYVAPDNGLLSRLVLQTPPSQIVRLANPEYWLTPLSGTFHGRDIMAPVAARLSLGLDPARLGPRQEKLVELDWPQVSLMPGRIEGEILRIDSFGNLVTNITAAMLAEVPLGRPLRTVCNQQETTAHLQAYGQRPEGTLVTLIGSTGRLELAVVGASAAAKLHARVGDKVVVTWQ